MAPKWIEHQTSGTAKLVRQRLVENRNLIFYLPRLMAEIEEALQTYCRRHGGIYLEASTGDTARLDEINRRNAGQKGPIVNAAHKIFS